MFEQAILTTRRRPWTLGLSFTLQSAFAGAVVLLSVITIERLPVVMLPAPLPPMPRAPRPVEIVSTEIQRGSAIVRGVFTAPLRIPSRVAMLVEEAAAGAIAVAEAGIAGTGLPYGVYTGERAYTGREFAAPPPPPPAVVKPAEKVPEPPKVIQLGGVVLAAKLIHRVMPVYPPLARQTRVSGTVKLEAIVGTNGAVKELRLISGHPLLTKSALDAVRQWRYSPTLLNGEPVEVNAPIDVNFTLTQ